LLAGAALATGGAVVQGVFRDPLVSPSILGTTAGASLGGQLAMLAMVSGSPLASLAVSAEMMLPLGCLAGQAFPCHRAHLLSRTHGHADSHPYWVHPVVAFPRDLKLHHQPGAGFLGHESAVVSFTLGGVGGVSTRQLLAAVPMVGIGIVACWLWSDNLDLLLSGEDEASSLGVEVGRADAGP